MSNIGTLLKSEISRLSRREIRQEVASLKKASAAYRRDIAALKRSVAALSKQAATVKRATAAAERAPAPALDSSARFQARGLRSLRKRLGLSQVELGKLAGVSGLTVYNWEAGKSTPRKQGLAAIVELRGIGKREANERLQAAKKAAAAKPAKAPSRGKRRKIKK